MSHPRVITRVQTATQTPRYRMSILEQVEEVFRHTQYTAKVLARNRALPEKHFEQLILFVNWLLSDEWVNAEVKAEAVGKLVPLIKKHLGIQRVDKEDVERVERYLQMWKGKVWLRAWFDGWDPENGEGGAEDYHDFLVNGRLAVAQFTSSRSLSPDLLHRAPGSTAQGDQFSTSSQHSRASSDICPLCFGLRCGRGLRCDVSRSPSTSSATADVAHNRFSTNPLPSENLFMPTSTTVSSGVDYVPVPVEQPTSSERSMVTSPALATTEVDDIQFPVSRPSSRDMSIPSSSQFATAEVDGNRVLASRPARYTNGTRWIRKVYVLFGLIMLAYYIYDLGIGHPIKKHGI